MTNPLDNLMQMQSEIWEAERRDTEIKSPTLSDIERHNRASDNGYDLYKQRDCTVTLAHTTTGTRVPRETSGDKK
jgi:hypothetical protein